MRARVASAGTGKTTSLVARYLEFVDEGVPLRRIAGVTFTRAAANQLRQRVAAGVREALTEGSYLGGLFVAGAGSKDRLERAERELAGAEITTIHGFMTACLRLNAPRIGLDPAFSVIAPSEAVALFEEESRSLALLARDPAHELHGHFTFTGGAARPLARELFTSRSLAPRFAFGAGELDKAVAAVYQAVYRRFRGRLGSQALDPGEIERRALALLDLPAARERLVRRFPVVLVDEFQDVNPLQGRFFELLAESGARLEVVGDPKQSIYLFRAADVSVFRRALEAAAATGELLPPLVETRRHGRAVARFLNRLTSSLGRAGKGFSVTEAPHVRPAGEQAAVEGSVELLVVEGDERLPALREQEAALLAERLARYHLETGTPYERIAVVARSHRSLVEAKDALAARGVPSLMLKGRGFYWRSEVRDVYHALSVGIEPEGPSLPAFLRGPFAALGPNAIAQVIGAPRPLERLAAVAPEVAERLRELARVARLPPVDAVREVSSAPLIGGRRFVQTLGRRERDNLDGLLLDIARRPPADIEALLANLQELALLNEHAEVPESGEGVRLMTVHASKGLEFDMVAVFNAGGGRIPAIKPVLVDPATGAVTLHASTPDRDAQARQREREEQEGYRLLYVAASRARDCLLVTLSVSREERRGWADALLSLDLEERPLAGVLVSRHTSSARADGAAHGAQSAVPVARADASVTASPPAVLEPATWIDERVPAGRFPPLMSPSRLVDLQALAAHDEEPGEPLGPSEVAAGGEVPDHFATVDDETPPATPASGDVPGRGRALGTLVHYAISRDWPSLDGERREFLGAQEAAWPFSVEQREELLDEVADLLARYRSMLGTELPALERRAVDRSEIALAVSGGGTVWEGVIDRLYQVDGRWVVEDYKTDRRVAPERYHVQLGLYLQAMARVLGVRPLGRLVYLRSATVVEPAPAALDAALFEAGVIIDGPGPDEPSGQA